MLLLDRTRVRVACIVGLWLISSVVNNNCVAAEPAGAESFPREQIEFFEKRVRPVLVSHCFDCHSEDNIESDLRLDSRAALLTGGSRGPALVPGKPKESLLVSAINHDDLLQMPPKDKLSQREIADLTTWIASGAAWPISTSDTTAPVKAKPLTTAITAADREFWSFQRPQIVPPPPVKNQAWVRTPIDQYLLAALEAKQLQPAPPASKRTLIRRATFDLTGLPPTPAAIEHFLADESPQAFERLVDRLLASSAYGERWGRHWLDVARYADSNGMDENLAFVSAFRYRDYVIRCFNEDVPYDRFVTEQLAGDLLPRAADESEASYHQRLIATGFLAIGPKMLADDDPKKKEMDIIDEQLDTLGKAFLGLTIGCARCHDHKFDPIPAADYYSLAGILKSTKTMENFGVVADWHEHSLEDDAQRARRLAYEEQLKAHNDLIKQRTAEAKETFLDAERAQASKYLLAAAHFVNFQPSAPDMPAPGDASKLQARLELDHEAKVESAIVVAADKFQRGTVSKVGVHIQNGGDGEFFNEAEYDIAIPHDGNYQIDLLYASGAERQWRLLINGELVKEDAANQNTGGFDAEHRKWLPEAVVTLKAGQLTIRFEQTGATPHLSKLALIPTTQPATHALVGRKAAKKQPAEIAKEQQLNRELLDQWIEYLQRCVKRTDSAATKTIWQAWIDLSATEDDATQSLRQALAERFQAKATAATTAWREQQQTNPKANKLDDTELEPYREVLFANDGPYRLPKKPDRFYSAAAKETLATLNKQKKKLEEERPASLQAMGVREGSIQNTHIHYRGNHTTLGPEVPRQFLRVIAGDAQTPIDNSQSGRLQLAQWLTDSAHPLTSRVMANRIWRWHFGRGIVRSVDNFGRLGEAPTNQALLDWLAVEFMRSGWSIKELHRTIMRSNAYQMSTAFNEQAAATDPENLLYWHFERRRLEAEVVRDAILAVSGRIDHTQGGSLMDFAPRAYVTGTGSRVTSYDTTRRSVYLPILRSAVYDVLQAFDFADPSTLEGNRATTTVAPQALFMMNGDIVSNSAAHLATGLLANEDRDDAARVQHLFSTVLGRPADANEVARCQQLIAEVERQLLAEQVPAGDARLRAWRSLCRVLLASNEFIYVE